MSKPTSDWSLDLGFCNQVDEFKVGKKIIDIVLKIKYNELTLIRYIDRNTTLFPQEMYSNVPTLIFIKA